MCRNSKIKLMFEEISGLFLDEIARKMSYKAILRRIQQGGPRAHLLLIWSLDPSLHHLIHMPTTAGE